MVLKQIKGAFYKKAGIYHVIVKSSRQGHVISGIIYGEKADADSGNFKVSSSLSVYRLIALAKLIVYYLISLRQTNKKML